MIPLEDAQRAILGAIRPAHATETVALAQAAGRFLAEAVAARVDHPAFDNSSMDGYALRVADLAPSDYVQPVACESHCGDAPPAPATVTPRRSCTWAPPPTGAYTAPLPAEDNTIAQRTRSPS